MLLEIQCSPSIFRDLQRFTDLQVIACSNFLFLLNPPSSFPAMTSSSLRISYDCQHNPWKTLYKACSSVYLLCIYICQNITYQFSTDLFSCLYFLYYFDGRIGGKEREMCILGWLSWINC